MHRRSFLTPDAWPRRAGLRLGGALLVLLFAVLPAGADTLKDARVSHFVLDNGLELFVYENHVVPLATVQITFRCGSVTQTPATAGLFHLYEHMLFKGNRVYRTEAAFQAAMKELGVASWNGGTTNEQVSYYFTVPSQKVGPGIAFWANAVRYPLFDAVELETEKQVVINEIRGYLTNPGDIFQAGINRHLYYAYPWRRDVTGSEANIAGATVASMRSIQERYYLPNNAALFVGGDVDPQEVLRYVEESFGSWKRGIDPWSTPPPPHPAPRKDDFLVYGDEQSYPGVAQVTVRFRGPDVLRDRPATYAADVWGEFMNDPSGRFRREMAKRVAHLYNKDYLWGFYYTQRDGAFVDFTTLLTVDSTQSIYERVENLLGLLRKELRGMAEDPGYFPARDRAVLTTKLADEKLLERETTRRLISSLSFYWASADTSYYAHYLDNLNRVERGDIVSFLSRYLTRAHAVVGVLLNPADLHLADAESHGFLVLDRTNAFWWREPATEGAR